MISYISFFELTLDRAPEPAEVAVSMLAGLGSIADILKDPEDKA